MKSITTRASLTSLACVLLSAPAGPAGAQAPPSTGVGARVRVSHTDPCCASPQVGALLSVTADSVVVRTGRGQLPTVIALPRQAVSSLEVGFVAGYHTGRGAMIGALAGTAIGVGAGLLTRDCGNDESCDSLTRVAAVVAGVGYGVCGLVIGGLIGRGVPRVHWVPVPVPERFGLAPARGGGLAVRLTLRL